jgi:hypothetical protein
MPVPLQTGITGKKEHRLVNLFAAEVALHQGFVLGLLDDPLDQRAPGLFDEVGVRGVRRLGGVLAAVVLVKGLGKQSDQAGAGRHAHRQVER